MALLDALSSEEWQDVNPELEIPSGLTKNWGGTRWNTIRGKYTVASCHDADGNCYLHLDAQPHVPPSFVEAAGGIDKATAKVKTAFK